ncbi:hypothetical protein R8Z50_02640 [Longispora sp. K20-0274]|uniref:DUF4190 domain-containing protein n=1 Tax=Longispora sp. K20-0274 TaxID=3088255 RepID=UPI00399B5A8B
MTQDHGQTPPEPTPWAAPSPWEVPREPATVSPAPAVAPPPPALWVPPGSDTPGQVPPGFAAPGQSPPAAVPPGQPYPSAPQPGQPHPYSTQPPLFAHPAPVPPMAAAPAPVPQWHRPPAPPRQPGPAITMAAVLPGPGGDFNLAYPAVRPIQSGVALGSLSAGIASLLVSIAVLCFGVTGADDGWGAQVGGAFALLGVVAGVAGLGLGTVALRQIRRARGELTGRGVAVGGLICAGVGLVSSVGALLLAVVLST